MGEGVSNGYNLVVFFFALNFRDGFFGERNGLSENGQMEHGKCVYLVLL